MLTAEISYRNKRLEPQQSIMLDLISIADTDNIKTTQQKAVLSNKNLQETQQFYKEKQVLPKTSVKSKLKDKEVIKSKASLPSIPKEKPKPKPKQVAFQTPAHSEKLKEELKPIKPKAKQAKPSPKLTEKKVVEKPKPVKQQSSKPKEAKQIPSEVDTFAKTVMQTLETSTSLQRQKAKSDSEILGNAKNKIKKEEALSISEASYIRAKISENWNTTSFTNAEHLDMYVDLLLKLNHDGTITDVQIKKSEGSRYSHYQLFLDSALTAVWRASPLNRLQQNHYDIWKEIIVSFTPSGMVY